MAERVSVATYTVGSRPLPAEGMCAPQAVDALGAAPLGTSHPQHLQSWCAAFHPPGAPSYSSNTLRDTLDSVLEVWGSGLGSRLGAG